MYFLSPLLTDAVEVADLPGDSVASLLRTIADHIGLFADDGPDGGLALLMSALAGVAAAVAVAIGLSVYFRRRHRSNRDLIRHGLAAAAVLGLLAFVAYDIRQAALAYLGINPTLPAVEFEIRLPKPSAAALADSQVEMHTDKNQALARVQRALALDEDGHSVLRGTVPLAYNTRHRVVILDLPGQAQCQFMLRLPASPSRSGQFGPWHLADRVAAIDGGGPAHIEAHEAYAIRYRVL